VKILDLQLRKKSINIKNSLIQTYQKNKEHLSNLKFFFQKFKFFQKFVKILDLKLRKKSINIKNSLPPNARESR